MSQEDLAQFLSGLGPAVTFIGVAMTLGSLRLMRNRLQRWKQRVLRLFGRQKHAVGEVTGQISWTSSATGVSTRPWNDEWTLEEKFEEIVGRIKDVQKSLSSHQHQDIDKRLDRFGDRDAELSDAINREVAKLHQDELISDKWAVGGLITTAGGAAISLAAIILG